MSDSNDTRSFPRFGGIYDVDLEPVSGSEIGKRRPAFIASNDINNQYSDTVTVLPITSQAAKKAYAFEVLVPKGTAGLTSDSRIKANQIRTIDKKRILRYRGVLPVSLLPQVEHAIKVHLNMS